LRSAHAIEALEIVHDGVVVESRDLRGTFNDSPLDTMLRVELSVIHSGWMVARAFFRAPDGLLRQAHTSPIYISVNGLPAAHRADVLYMLRWIDQLERLQPDENEIIPNGHRAAIQATYAEARDVYQALLGRAIDDFAK
jgi:hypothetical protein